MRINISDCCLLICSFLSVLLFGSVCAAATATYTTSGGETWTAPSGVTSVTVEAWGGGGAGGGATGKQAGGGGGAGGQYVRKVVTVVPGNNYALVVGAGGIGSSGNGAAGGDSTFDGSTVVAKGGGGGNVAASDGIGGGGGTGASADEGVGDTVFVGGSGSSGTGGSSSYGGAGGGGAGSTGSGGHASGAVAGSGTDDSGGDGGAGQTSKNNSGNPGNTAGGGGGGGQAQGNPDQDGGDGAAGRVSITYDLSPVVDCISGVVTNGLPKMQVAAFTVINTYDLKVPTTVNFTQDFDVPPLVFTLPTTDGGDVAAHRIRNITSTGFQIMTLEPEGEDGPHIAMGLNYLAIEPGVYVLPDGHRLEACSFETTKAQQKGENDEWETLAFLSDFSQTPAMLGQVQTMNNEAGNIPEDHSTPWLTTAISSVSAAGTKIALERSEAVSGEILGTERIAYLAAEPTEGRKSFDLDTKTIDYEILLSDAQVHGWGDCENIYYSSPWTDASGTRFRPIPLASMNTRGGDDEAGEDDGGWFRRCPENSVSNESTRLRLSVDEIRKGSSNADGNRSKTVGERAGVFVFSDNFVTNPVNLDHFRFVHSATGVTCLPSTVELYACEDSDCTTLYTGNVTVNLSPSDSDSRWSGPSLIANQIEFSGGFVELQLRHFQPGEVTLDANGTPVSANELVCMSGGAVSDCGITFSDAGFTIDVPDLVANKPDGPVTIRAVKSDPADATVCTPAFIGSRKVSLWSSYEDPDTGTMSVSLDGATIASDSSGTKLDLVFDANAEASISQIHYADAGQLGLNARFEGSGEEAGLVMTGTGMFVSRPVGLAVLTTDSDADCLSGDHNCSVFKRSGETFNLTVRGVAWTHDGDTNLNDNPVTPNYQHADIDLGHNLVAPLSGDLGTLGESSVSITTSGESILSQSISEVGVFRFTALPTENSYFGLTVPGGESANIGRFIPDRFTVGSNTPLFASSCAASFTYLGQPFDYIVVPQLTVTALNTSGNATLNYGGDFWMLVSSLDGRSHVDNSGSGLTLTMNDSGTVSWSGTSDYDGTGQASISGMSLVYSKPAPAIVPFNSDVDLTFAATDFMDSDGVCLDSDSDGICDSYRIANIGDTEQRFGRLRLQNAYGSELLNLIMPLQIEYFSVGGFFTANSQDGCTSLTTADHLQNSVDAANWTAGDTSVPVGSGTTSSSFSLMPFISGAAELIFTAPGADNVGTVYVRSSLLGEFPWLLQDKDGDGNLDEENAKVTFGIFKGNQRLIYMRESIW